MAINWGNIVNYGTQAATAASAIAASRQKGRETQATQQAPVDRLNQDAYQTDISAKARGLEAKEAGLLARALGQLQEQAAARKAPGERATTSLRGDILANAVDAKFNGGSSRIPKFEFSGGLRPGMFSANTRQLGGEMSRAALLDQLKGESTPFSDLPAADFDAVINAKGAPGGTPLPEGSKLDSILSAIGTYGSAGAQIANAGNKPGAGAEAAPIPTPQVAQMPGMVLPPAPPPVPGTFLPPQAPPPPPPQVAMSSPRPFAGVRF